MRVRAAPGIDFMTTLLLALLLAADFPTFPEYPGREAAPAFSTQNKGKGKGPPISPVPEPAEYGAMLMGSLAILYGWRKIARSRPVS